MWSGFGARLHRLRASQWQQPLEGLPAGPRNAPGAGPWAAHELSHLRLSLKGIGTLTMRRCADAHGERRLVATRPVSTLLPTCCWEDLPCVEPT